MTPWEPPCTFFRATYRQSWRVALVVALIGGLLGAAAMAALAGARRTDSAYGRYLQAAKASDVMIDIPGPILSVVRQVDGLPGKLSAGAWLGLTANPVIRGKVDPSFQTDGIAGSLDGEYFRQDKMTVLAGKLPALDAQEVPVLGLLSQLGSVEPPTTSGHALAGADQIELGAVTMRQLHVHVGDRVRVGPDSKPFTVAGVVTLPSFGTVLTDHPSLGRGAMMDEAALLAVQHFPPYVPATFKSSTGISQSSGSPSYPSTVALDATSGAAASRAVSNLLRADPDQEDPGGMYLPPQQGAQVTDLRQMGGLPLSISLGVALAAVLALVLTIAASVRQRRRELALLKSLGMLRGQLRVVVACQASTILLVAVAIGLPLGIAAGRWAWTAFASEIGVVPALVVPGAALALGALALLAAGNLLASWPAAAAARTPVARVLRSE